MREITIEEIARLRLAYIKRLEAENTKLKETVHQFEKGVIEGNIGLTARYWAHRKSKAHYLKQHQKKEEE